MIHWLAWLTIGLMLGLAAMQSVYVALYLRCLRRTLPTDQRPDLDWKPPVAVILCLRGTDPSLHRCLAGLSQLDYPDFELHLVFDDLTDPAIAVVDRFFENSNRDVRVQRHLIADRGPGRSLKCSALISAILQLDDRIEIVALVDADASVEPDWLSRLIAPLKDPQVGAATGNRWFAPDSGVGSLVRKIWNAAALPQMTLYRIPWGGSLALRRETIDQCNLLDRWSVAFCEDTMLTSRLAEFDLTVVRVPDLIIVNRETTTLREALTWIGRQLLTVRLYHAAWIWVLIHALVGAICLFAPPLVVLFFVITLQWLIALLVLAAWVFQLVLNLVLVQLIEMGNWAAMTRATSTDRGPSHGIICFTISGLLASLMLQLIYPFLAIGATFRQRVRWRGITYRLGSRGRIEMDEYHPYVDVASDDATGSERSIG